MISYHFVFNLQIGGGTKSETTWLPTQFMLNYIEMTYPKGFGHLKLLQPATPT